MKSVALLLIIIAMLSVSGAVAISYVINQKIVQEDREFSYEQELLEIEKNRVINALSGVVGLREISKGFWFEYSNKTGEIELVFVSVGDLAAQKLSANELGQVAVDIGSGRIIDADNAKRRSEEELSQNLQFHNGVYSSLSGGVSTKICKKLLRRA